LHIGAHVGRSTSGIFSIPNAANDTTSLKYLKWYAVFLKDDCGVDSIDTRANNQLSKLLRHDDTARNNVKDNNNNICYKEADSLARSNTSQE
jgi:hypothetical protein